MTLTPDPERLESALRWALGSQPVEPSDGATVAFVLALAAAEAAREPEQEQLSTEELWRLLTPEERGHLFRVAASQASALLPRLRRPQEAAAHSHGDDRCCPRHQHHVSPHRGCFLR